MSAARSRLMATLDAAIAGAPNPIEAKCLRAERAGLLARQGQLEAAKNVIDELNAQLAWHPNTPLRAWLALAEGLHGYYSALGRGAQVSIEQAYMLARELGALKRLHAVAARREDRLVFDLQTPVAQSIGERFWPTIMLIGLAEVIEKTAAKYREALTRLTAP